MSAQVLLPISDWEERLLGRRLITETATFETKGFKIYHNEPNPSTLTSIPTNPPATLSPLQKLPPEIRLQILAEVFKDVKPTDWLSAHYHDGATPASVIFTCRQLYREGRELALKACTFEYAELPGNSQMFGYEYNISCDWVFD
ncbi:MAG: hypothetical protein LQ346_008875, partial [Caloplaca aetnensis]